MNKFIFDNIKYIATLIVYLLYLLPGLAFTFAIVLFILLLFPDIIPKVLIENIYSNEYWGHSEIIFLISLCITITLYSFFSWVIKCGKNSRLKKKQKVYLLNQLQKLNPREQSVLRELVYLCSPDAPLNHPDVSRLQYKGIIEYGFRSDYFTSPSNGGYILVPMKLNPIVEKHITWETLGLQENMTEQEKKEFILNNRPEWTTRSAYYQKLY